MWIPLAPPVMAEMAQWGKMNELLQVRLLPRGWSHDNPRNLPRTISPGGASPSSRLPGMLRPAGSAAARRPKYAKGVETARAIERNGQLAFDYFDPGIGEACPRGTVSAESISPCEYVDAWTEQIMLPAIELDNPEVTGKGAKGDTDTTVAVERR
jgi:hypothetical protein